jgi:mannose-6-phosphate isomerase-like protein (cupin superfamily)
MEQLTDSTDDRAPKRGMTFHYAADALEPFEAGVLTPQLTSDDSAAAAIRLEEVGWPMTGAVVKVLVSQTNEEGGFQLHYLWFKPHYVLRPHHHLADCLYYVVSGSAHMGKRILRAGDSFFVPSGVRYQYGAGPEGAEILEIRRGARVVDTVVADQTPERWQKMIDLMATHRAEWEEMEISPTFAQNSQIA